LWLAFAGVWATIMVVLCGPVIGGLGIFLFVAAGLIPFLFERKSSGDPELDSLRDQVETLEAAEEKERLRTRLGALQSRRA
jgi:hypothetical protein